MTTLAQQLRRPALSGLDIHVGAVIVLGVVVLATSLHSMATTPPPLSALLFATFGLMAGACAVKVPGVSALVSASDTFFIASAMIFGPGPAMVALAIDSVILTRRHGYSMRRLLFNATEPAFSLWAATCVFQLLAGGASALNPSTQITGVLLPLAAMTAVFFGLNSGLLAIAIALESGKPLFIVWKRFAPLAVNYGAAASAAFCFVIVMRTAGVLAASAVVPLVLVLHVTLRSILGRLGDAETHILKVDRLYLSTIETLATAIEAKDGVTHDHIRRVQRFAIGLANALGVKDQDTIKAIKAAALLHDTGKLAVPERILNKPGKLTSLEFEEMKLHVDVGADILSSIDFPYPVVPIVRAHHESWDGSGYPRGLKGDEIPIGARILSVVDCFDALTSDRPYRPAMTDDDAINIVIDRRGNMYDPLVVDTFLKVYREIAAEVMEPLAHQEALSRIGRAISAPQPLPAPVTEIRADAPDDLLAIVSLSRILGGEVTFSDAAALATTHLSRILPDATHVFYVHDAASGRLVARHATGQHAAALRGMSMGMGERLSGWVAACRQTITNSDGALDLYDRDVKLGSALSTPFMDGDRLVGVFTAYAPSTQAFSEDQSRLVEMMAPHLGRILGAALRSESQRTRDVMEPRAASGGSRDLRIIFSRQSAVGSVQ
jgi:putative nucleotidyltransferase with HDIG domain